MFSDHTLMQMVYVLAQYSKCCSWKVGAIITQKGRIISTGYNGTHSGAKNCCDHAKESGWLEPRYNPVPPHENRMILSPQHREDHSNWSKINEIHAELNSIIFAASNGVSIRGGTMYVNLSPCPECAKAIAQSGITKLVYAEKYDKSPETWSLILESANIEIQQIPVSELNLLNWDNIDRGGSHHF